MDPGVALFFGIFIGIVISFLTWVVTKKPVDPSRTDRPPSKLTEDVKKEIRDEIRNDNDRQLVERILKKLNER